MRFHDAKLIRVLARFAESGGPESRQTFAGRLGDWLSVTDALALSAALEAPDAPPSQPPDPSDASASRGAGDAALASAAETGAAARRGRARVEAAVCDAISAFSESATDFPTYRRHHLGFQRDMAARIAPLRQALRAELTIRSPSLARIAWLDAVFERALADRERSLLASVPVLLGRRFEQLRGETDGWLARFHDELREALRAELALRLQPIDGLIAALDNQAMREQ